VGAPAQFDLLPFFGTSEARFHFPLDIEFHYITSVLCLAQGNQHIPTVSLPIAVDDKARRTVIIGDCRAVTPSIIFKGNDVVLEEFDLLTFAEEGPLAFAIQKLKRCVVVEDFVHALRLAK
jgi:hypothetical protein